ncbi:uncharacterized protein LOC112349056 [Selaginella moellendorffii]|uniref:uncharacterized protein LOC112349056 n=1 Tax=Selaginella moellendorffii TaxID=88036 RepID=UPI000D1C4A6B|nr:uncharacterized protein LOC112349056 [Selaginella moellendorffii]|eukprot:XP_024538495.1 uncharacterized protein LOC112349056 [Selaginella moellendorffii]
MVAATIWRLLGGGGYRGRGYAKNDSPARLEKLDRSGTGPGSEKSPSKLAVWQWFGSALECEGDNEGSVGCGAGRDTAGNSSARSNVQAGVGEAIPLEYNPEDLNAIDFDNGAIIFLTGGKEISEAVSPGAEIVDAESSTKMDTVTIAQGFALVRLKAVSKPLSIGGGMQRRSYHTSGFCPR